MKSWIKYCQAAFNRRFLVPLAAVAMVLSLTAYEFEKPVERSGARAAAAPLDDNSVSALLSLDRAMEALAARVTPAIVNVTVTAKKGPAITRTQPKRRQRRRRRLQRPAAVLSANSSAASSASRCGHDRRLSTAWAAA